MNAQLDLHLAHLETFDSDEEFSESPSLHQEEHVQPVQNQDGLINPVSASLLRSKARLRKFVKPKSLREALEKILWVLPVAIALGDYIGMVLSTSLSLFAVVLMQLKPLPPGEPDSDGGVVISNMHVLDQYDYHCDEEEISKVLQQKKKQVQDCRKEVSRLLGLAGAPPLEWKATLHQRRQDLQITNVATIAVVKFLEAHVQFLLTVDQAYQNLQLSTSLHLGLGPASQCVERVERAAIAREFRNRRKQSIGASLIRDGVGGTLEPQRGTRKAPILALAMTRTHLAKSMVEQSNSLIQVWKGVRLSTTTKPPSQLRTPQAGTAPLPNMDQLACIPDVVDLSWIKMARQQLAGLLSYMMDYFCTLDVLQTLSESRGGARSRLEESMCHVKNAREHLLCTLLLGKKPPAKALPTRTTSSDSNDNNINNKDELQFLRSMMQYRDQLDALKGALWSCQQYNLVGDDIISPDHKTKARILWWSQIRQLGSACRAMEEEIGQNFAFLMKNDKEEHVTGGGDENESAKNTSDPATRSHETGSYEHSLEPLQSNDSNPGMETTQTKTMVFKGKGAKEDRANHKKGKNSQVNNNTKHSDGGVPLPPRDTVSEQLLVMELKNRIQTVCPPSDDDDDDDDDDLDKNDNHVEHVASSDENPNDKKGRQEATSLHFLGATGSLLTELKGSLPVMDTGEEEILGE